MCAAVLFGTYILLKYQGVCAACEFYLLENTKMIQLGETTSIYLCCKMILVVAVLCYRTAFSWVSNITFCLDVWSVFIVPSGYLVHLSCFWSVTAFLVWCRLLTSLHMVNLVMSFASPNFICSFEKHSHFSAVPPQWYDTDKGRYMSLYKLYSDLLIYSTITKHKAIGEWPGWIHWSISSILL